MRTKTRVVLWAALALVVGCGGDTDADAGIDASIEMRDGGAGTDGGETLDASAADAGGSDADVAADAAALDTGVDAAADAGPDAEVADAGADGGDPGCVTSFTCEAETAPTECGVLTTAGRRHPDLGAPYCSDILSRASCTCDLTRCESPGPLCPGTYTLTVRQRMISGCSGVAGELSGTCESMWNVVEPVAGGAPLVDRMLYNVYLSFDFADYTDTFTLTAPTPVRVRVEQDCWLSDVSGSGNAGRGEVDRVSVGP